MNVTILAIGKMKDKALLQLQEEYCKRLKAFCTAQVIEVKDEPCEHEDRASEITAIREKECERALEKIKDGDYCVLLDLRGKMYSSETFAKALSGIMQGASSIVFVIAGSYGPSEALIRRANARWKLSDLTFTHLMTRVLVLEQIYRAFMILNGRKYHK